MIKDIFQTSVTTAGIGDVCKWPSCSRVAELITLFKEIPLFLFPLSNNSSQSHLDRRTGWRWLVMDASSMEEIASFFLS